MVDQGQAYIKINNGEKITVKYDSFFLGDSVEGGYFEHSICP